RRTKSDANANTRNRDGQEEPRKPSMRSSPRPDSTWTSAGSATRNGWCCRLGGAEIGFYGSGRRGSRRIFTTPRTRSPSPPFRSGRGRRMVAIRTNPSERAEALVEHDRTPLRDRRLAAVQVAVCPVQTFRGLVEREMTQGLRRSRSHVGSEELFDGAVVNPERSLLLEPKTLERHDEPREVASRVGQIVLVEVDPHHARSAQHHV